MARKHGAEQTAVARDPRQVRTREALQSALLELLQRTPLDQITVRDICETANVGYATFFRHHPTKESLLQDVASDQIKQLLGLTLPLADADDRRAASTALFNYVAAHRSLWSTLLTGGAASTLREEFLRLTRELAATRRLDPGRWPPVDVAIVLMVTATIELISWWLLQPQPLSIDEMADIHEHLILTPAVTYKTVISARPGRR
jgi:AcrR family transcriptional regulator